VSDLLKLAQLRRVDSSYRDHWGEVRHVSPDTLVAVLRALGEPLSNEQEAAECLRAAQAGEPKAPAVVVAWDGELALEGVAGPGALGIEGEAAFDDGLLVSAHDRSLRSVRALPYGVHTLRLDRHRQSTVTVISAPRRTRPLEGGWGLFAPTYALRDDRATTTGDFTCLGGLCELAGRLGASHVSTLPLLAGFSKVDDPSAFAGPYSPLSRLWWNEAYLDPRRVPELAGLSSGELEPSPHYADVARAGARLRPLLDVGLQALRRAGDERLSEYEAFCDQTPGLHLYGLFRAAVETAGLPPERWPATFACDVIRAGREVPADAVAAHMYAQWLCDEQLTAVRRTAEASGCGLMLDLPIGCRPDGFDPWAYRESFAVVADGYGVSVGAPPDRFFQAGQNWGFRPLSPEGDRQSGYPVLRGCLAQLMRHCSALRIDHVMGFQRLWWIPSGAPASQGAYVHYQFEEILALTCLEAWRRNVAIAGEDLGTVDPQVRLKLQEHRIAGMHVGVFDIAARPEEPLQPRPGSMAFVDTHDTATLAGWLRASDIEVRSRLGFLDDSHASAERNKRQVVKRQLIARLVGANLLDPASTDDPTKVHAAVLDELGRSAAGLVSVNVEDLWGEADPQNIPGTDSGHANFSRRLAFTLAEIEDSPDMTDPLRHLDHVRRQAATRTTTGSTSP
jgi:4-alpha-glucanotransferase